MASDQTLAISPLDLSRLSSTLQKQLPFSACLDRCVALAGDASNRRYYRLHISGAPVSSLILMQLADPEGFKASEEAVGRQDQEISELPFINLLKYLQTVNVAVPVLYFYDEPAGLLYLEDFGDVTLAQACHEASVETIERLYRQAIDVLVRMHAQGTASSHSPCLAFSRSFDVPLYLWEFDHFLEYGIVARREKLMCSLDYLPIREEFQKIAEWLASQPTVLTHRDFHSRNLMVDGERLGVIDFQDALLGPTTYGPTHDREAFPPAELGIDRIEDSRVEVNVVADVEIQVPIPIDVSESGAGAPPVVPEPGLPGHLSKRPVAIVAIEDVWPVVGHQQIGIAIVVVVRDGHASSPAPVCDSRS